MPAEPRFYTPRNPDRRTLGPEVGDIMRQLGSPPMPWQQDCLDVAYELDEDETEAASSAAGKFQPRLWYREDRLTVPRQSGKTEKAKGRHAHRMLKSLEYGWAQRALSLYMAQTATDAREKLVEEWFPALEDSPFFIPSDREGFGAPGSDITQFIKSNGRETIRWQHGRTTVKPPSRKGGHGGSPDLIDLDEAFAHQDGQAEQGVKPGMITRISPQLWIVSTAGDASSEYLWEKVEDGRRRCIAGDHGQVFYLEFSAYPGEPNTPVPASGAEGVDIKDPAVLERCSPALGHTIRLENLLADIDGMRLEEAQRAYGNIWTKTIRRIISEAAWTQCLDRASQPEGQLWMAVDASPGDTETRTASIAIAGWRSDGQVHVQLMEYGPGLSWVAGSVEALTRRHRQVGSVYYDSVGPVRAIARDIQRAARCRTEDIDGTTMAAACQRLHEDVVTGQGLRHIGQAELDAAVEGAARRQLGDSWAWARRTSGADISPLVAVTEAYWAAVQNPPRRGNPG